MYLRVNGIRLYYQKMGAGPAVVLLHGNGEDHRIFDATAALLSRDFTVYAMDSRGHGKSSPAEHFSYDEMAEDAAGLVRALGLRRPYLCGFSDGGIIGLLAAIWYPGLFCGMTVCGANLEPKGIKDGWMRLFRLIYQRTKDPKVLMMLTGPCITEEQLSKIQIPVQVTAGSRDLIKEDHTRRIAAAIPESSLRILPGEGHGSYIVHSRKLYWLLMGHRNVIDQMQRGGFV